MVRSTRSLAALALLASLAAAGCGSEPDDNLRDAYDRMMASAERRAAAEPAPVEAPAAVTVDTAVAAPAPATLPIDTLPTAAAPPAATPTEVSPTDPAAEPTPAPARGATATLREVRTAEHQGFDRIVFQFDEDAPGFQIGYIDAPIRECGSGRTIPVAGQAFLRVRFAPARAHETVGESSRATVTSRNRPLDLGVVQQAVLVCDFEGQVEWVLGIANQARYRTLELREPTRIVLDVTQ